jgi:hypothetical protein
MLNDTRVKHPCLTLTDLIQGDELRRSLLFNQQAFVVPKQKKSELLVQQCLKVFGFNMIYGL